MRDAPVVEALNAVVAKHGRWGFWKCHDRLRLQGHAWNHKRIWRVYCAMKLNLPRRAKKRLIRPMQPLDAPLLPNEVWSLDFMSDSLYQGRRFRTLNILDEGVREALAIEIDTSLPAQRVVRVLQQLETWRGLPKAIRLDNGPNSLHSIWPTGAKTRVLNYVSSSRASRIKMLSLSASTDPTGPRCSTAGCSRRWMKCAKLRTSGYKATTKNDPMTRWEACPRLCSVSDCSQGRILLLNCLLDGGAYALTHGISDTTNSLFRCVRKTRKNPY